MDLSGGSMPPKLPPSTLSVRFCPECGRSDRYGLLRDSHTQIGGLGSGCDGVVQVATYRLDSTTLPSHSDRDVDGPEQMA